VQLEGEVRSAYERSSVTCIESIINESQIAANKADACQWWLFFGYAVVLMAKRRKQSERLVYLVSATCTCEKSDTPL
jgi:hypothetical protein